MKNKEKKKSHLTRRAVFFMLFGSTIVLLILIWFGVEIATSGVKPNVYEAFSIDDDTEIKPKIIDDDKFNDMKIEFYCTTYQLAKTDSDGNVINGSMKLSLNITGVEDGASCTDVTAKVCLAAKWCGYASSSSTSYSFGNLTSTTKKTPSISITSTFPQKGLGGMKTIKNPNAYVYVTYNLNSKSKAVILEYNFNEYFIEGTSVYA